jgi:ribonucleoside-diphosphate reductase alpha chain
LRGLKTTYYLRTLGASSAEKSTGKGGELNAVSAHGAAQAAPAAVATPVVEVKVAPAPVPVVAAKAVVPDAELDSITDGPACFLRPGDPGFEECEACQ